MTESRLAFASIAEIGAGYRSGAFSPVEITRLCLDRIERHDGALNAFLSVLADPALASAAEAERELRAGTDRGALHGVPVALKDLVEMAGVPSKYGAAESFHTMGQKDAPLVARLRAAGAVVLGKTNLLEFAYGAVHPDVGQTNNPWDPGRTSGGSSGGSTAAAAAGLCYAAVGTDTGGSIRIPAAYCGIVGLKPSYGLVPLDGVFPLSWSLDHAGPLARCAADAAAFLAALAPDGGPPKAVPCLAGLRLGLIPALNDSPAVEPDVGAAFNDACGRLRAAGVELVEVAIPHLAEATGALMLVMMPEASVIHAERLERNAAAYSAITREQIELGFLIPATAQVRAQRYRQILRREFEDVLGQVDALLTHSVPWSAPIEDPPVDADGGSAEMLFCAPQNLTGLPAVSLPCGLTDLGLPVGLQLTGHGGRDQDLLALAGALETVLPPIGRPRRRAHEPGRMTGQALNVEGD